MPGTHVIIPTHTTRHLRLTLLGVATQQTPPEAVTITCDVVDEAIAELVEACSKEFGLSITLIRRAHQGKERLAQVRNNAVRQILADDPGRDPRTRLLFLDGDCFAYPGTIATHEAVGREAELVVAYRINLTEAQTNAFDETAAKRGDEPVEISRSQRRELGRRAFRYDLQALGRRTGMVKLGLLKGHKPKPLGGHHSVTLGSYVAVNGHDEAYHTWGTEDDDFGRRVYRSGGRCGVAVRSTTVLHLYHPSRAGAAWHDRDNAKRFQASKWEDKHRCEHGLENAMPQETPEVLRFG